MNFAAQMQNDKPRWDIDRAELGEENTPGVPLVLVPVHQNGSNKQRSKEQCVRTFFEIEFEALVSLPTTAFGCSSHFGLGLFVLVVACG